MNKYEPRERRKNSQKLSLSKITKYSNLYKSLLDLVGEQPTRRSGGHFPQSFRLPIAMRNQRLTTIGYCKNYSVSTNLITFVERSHPAAALHTPVKLFAWKLAELTWLKLADPEIADPNEHTGTPIIPRQNLERFTKTFSSRDVILFYTHRLV